MKIAYTVDSNGVHINGVTASNPVIYCNDMFFDSPEGFYLWLKANRKEVNLVGNISTRNMHIPPNIKNSHESTWREWTEAYDKAMAIGLKNIPPPIKGSDDYLRKPASGVIEQTQRKDSPGSDLIISEARKASAAKPLVIFDGGFVTSLANAYLKDNSIADKVVIIHIDGYENTMHNGVDYWATEIVMKKFRYIDWHGSFINNQVTWYAPFRPLQVNLNAMPSNPWTNLLRDNYYHQSYAQWHDLGDAPGAMWFFDNSLWKNVVRRTANRQTTTSDTFDYLLVSDNNWPKYGPMLSAYMTNQTNYIPVTTTPPVNVAPSVQITNTQTTLNVGNVTLTSVASDPDGTISKVEFFNGTTKLGEDTAAPYSFNWNAPKGTHVITARATDNQGAVTTSMAVTFTINDVVTEPPPTGTVTVGTTTTLQPGQPATVVSTPTQTGIALNFGIPQGIQGPPGQPGSGSGGGNLQQYKIYSVTDYGATGNGTTDDLPAIKRATDDAIRNKGKLVFPPAQNFYRINSTWEVNLSTDNQLWLDIEMIGTRRGFGIVYMGPSNGKAVRFMGNKAGIISGLKVKIGNNITNTIGIHITTGQYGVTSTSCFTFNNCEVEVNDGINNDAWVLGEDFPVQGDDISQILFNGCTAWGTFPAGDSLSNLPKGQTGWEIRGINTLQLTWVGGGVVYLETGINVVRSGSAYFYGLGGSRIGTFFKSAWSNNFTINGGRFEYFRKFIEVNSGGHPIVTVQGSPMTEDFVPLDGKLIEFNSAGTLILDGCKFGSDASKPMYDARAITLGGSGGAFFMRGGAIKNTTQDLLTATPGWRISVQNVARLDSNHENAGYFNNR